MSTTGGFDAGAGNRSAGPCTARPLLPVLAAGLLLIAACGPRGNGEDSSKSAFAPVPEAPASADADEDDRTVERQGSGELDGALPDEGVAPDPPSDLTTSDSSRSDLSPTTTNAPTTPGTYTYAVTGTINGEAVFGLSTLAVSEPDGDGRQSHIEETPGGSTTTVYRLTDEGRYLETVTIAAGAEDRTLTADEPFLLVPAGAGGGTSTVGRLSGDDAVADVAFTLIEMDGDRMIYRIVTRLAARVGNSCVVAGTMTSTAAARSADQLPLDIRAESEMETSGGGSCGGHNASRTRSLLND